MLGLPMLDVIIGLVFVYLLMALICATAMEMMVGLFDSRSGNLLLGIQNLLGEHLLLLLPRRNLDQSAIYRDTYFLRGG